MAIILVHFFCDAQRVVVGLSTLLVLQVRILYLFVVRLVPNPQLP